MLLGPRQMRSPRKIKRVEESSRQPADMLEQGRELTGAAMHVADREYRFALDGKPSLAPFGDRERT